MKKLSIMFAALALAMGFTACDSETKPVLEIPAQEEGVFVLNTPQLANEYLQLVKGGTTEFICSQPNYGVALQTNYAVQVSLKPNFADFRDIPTATPTSTTLVIDDNTLSAQICSMLGIADQDAFNTEFDGAIPVYFRATCEVPNAPTSKLYSNVVELRSVQYYFATLDPGWIYLVGNVSGWKEPGEGNAAYYEQYKLWETGYNTGVYGENPDLVEALGEDHAAGIFEMPEAPMFRFYTALTGWEQDSLGLIVDDNATDVAFDEEGIYTSSCVHGKGAWSFPAFKGGKVKLTVDLNKMTVTFQVIEENS